MHLPHIVPFSDSPIYFFTMCTAGRKAVLANETVSDCLRGVWRRSAEQDAWFVGRYVIMPDHVHFFARPAVDAKPRSNWLKMMKSVTARGSRVAGLGGSLWQADTFDHILRDPNSYSQKWEYVRENPVRAKLVGRAEEWPWQGEIHSLRW